MASGQQCSVPGRARFAFTVLFDNVPAPRGTIPGGVPYAPGVILGSQNVDTITGFVSGTDLIVLENAIFTQLAAGALSAANFVVGNPTDTNDYLVYDITTGSLYYDTNGSGVGKRVLFAELGAGTTLAFTDITVT